MTGLRLPSARRRRRSTPATAVIGVVFSAAAITGIATAPMALAQAAPGGGSAVLTFSVTVEAPIMQITEDEPTAQFHPEGEGDYGYSFASLDPSGETALASLLWPGAAAGNAGTLAEVLGVPGLSALNDPIRAQATSGTSQTQQSTSAPTGTTMSATVQPPVPGDQFSSANSSVAGGGLGPVGTAGSSTSTSTIHFDSSTGNLTAAAQSSATGIDLDGGLINIGSVTSSAQATSDNGGQPQLSGNTLVHNMTIAGQAAYVDGSGVHVGQPGKPAPAPVQDAVNSALQQAGMQIYFTTPSKITVGGVKFYDASSILFYWVPPGDSSHNSFTASIGGAAVSMDAASSGFPTDLSGLPSADTGSTGGGIAAQPAVDNTPTGTAAAPALSLPTGEAPALTSQPHVAPPTRTQLAAPPSLAAASLPGGLGAGWIVLLALAGVLGALALTRVPGLVASSSGPGAAGCPNQKRLRPDRRGGP